MNGKQLKNSILQWAIQGKLVPQDPNDEPASVLLERIRAEKKRLIKEGKIKKDKNESIIFRGEDNSHYEKFADGTVKCIDEEIPFEIPMGWEWTRIRNVSQSYIGLTYSPAEVSPKGVVVLRSSNIKEGKIHFDDIVRVNKTIPDKLWVEKNDIIICARNGSKKLVGKSAIVQEVSEPMTFGAFMAICKTPLWQFVYYFLQSDLFFSQLREVSGTTTINQLTQNSFNSFLLPIPPTNEQNRISAKLQTLLLIIEKYNEQQDVLDELNGSLKLRLQKSILQEAIQGLLVRQDSSDETASVLLDRIRSEKYKLLREGKLKKKDVVESVIFKDEDNKYYETIAGNDIEIELPYFFPTSWAIVRLQSICALLDGEKKTGDGICLDANYLRGKSKGEHLQSGKFVHKGDSIILVDGENSGEVFAVPVDGYMGSTFKQLWISNSLHIPYVLAFIRFYKDQLRNSKKGAAIPHLNKNIFKNLIIGIPPIHEQVRIIEKLNSINENL